MAAGPRTAGDLQAGEGRALAAVALGREYEVEPGARLPTLDQPQAEAFAARDRRGARRDLFALLGHPGVVPRLPLLSALARLERLPFVAPLAAEAVFWPGAGAEQRFLIVLTRPKGPRLASAAEPRFRPFSEEQLVEGLLRPLLPLLKELATQGITHRNIRADNLFLFEAAARGLGLGDCFAAPPGLDQPALYEPIDAMLADPRGRGAGEAADDLYALGATAA